MNATHTPAADTRKTRFVSQWANVITGAVIALIGSIFYSKGGLDEFLLIVICGVVLAVSGFGRMLTSVQEELHTGSQLMPEDTGSESSASRTDQDSPQRA